MKRCCDWPQCTCGREEYNAFMEFNSLEAWWDYVDEEYHGPLEFHYPHVGERKVAQATEREMLPEQHCLPLDKVVNQPGGEA